MRGKGKQQDFNHLLWGSRALSLETLTPRSTWSPTSFTLLLHCSGRLDTLALGRLAQRRQLGAAVPPASPPAGSCACAKRALKPFAPAADSGRTFKRSPRAVPFLASSCGGAEGPAQPTPGTARCFGEGAFW